jgi:hypothetical protein
MSTTPTPNPEPEVSASDELRLLGQIMARVAKLSASSKMWLLNRLSSDTTGDHHHGEDVAP